MIYVNMVSLQDESANIAIDNAIIHNKRLLPTMLFNSDTYRRNSVRLRSRLKANNNNNQSCYRNCYYLISRYILEHHRQSGQLSVVLLQKKWVDYSSTAAIQRHLATQHHNNSNKDVFTKLQQHFSALDNVLIKSN